MAVSGFVGRRNIQGIDVDVIFPEEVYAKIPFPLKVVIVNKKRFMPCFLIRVNIGSQVVLFPFVEEKGEKIVEYKIDSRGVYKIESITVCSVFPFSFFIRCESIKLSLEKVVFPQPKKCNIIQDTLDIKHRKKGEKNIDKTGFEGDILSIRDYKPSTPVKYIHWKVSAKTDSLKEKELSQISSEPVIIKFEQLKFSNIEEKLSCLTYLVIKSSHIDRDIFIEYKKQLFNLKLKNHRLSLLEIFAKM